MGEKVAVMKVVQIVKQLNNTELGKSGTHDTYVLVPADLDVSGIFEETDVPVEFMDRYSGQKVTVRKTVGRETRIVGLGQYYRKEELCAGDEIIFEKRVRVESAEYCISTCKKRDGLVIQKTRHGFEILTPERLEAFREKALFAGCDVEIRYLGSEKKRNDSPETTDFYDVRIDGESLLDFARGKKELMELDVRGGELVWQYFYGWKKCEYEMEE